MSLRAFALRALPLIIALFTLGGCAITPDMSGLTTRLDRVKGNGSEVTVTVAYINNTVNPIGLADVKHEIVLSNLALGTAENPRGVGLPAQQTSTQTFTFAPITPGLADSLRGKGPIPYTLISTVKIVAGEIKSEYVTRSEGVITVE